MDILQDYNYNQTLEQFDLDAEKIYSELHSFDVTNLEKQELTSYSGQTSRIDLIKPRSSEVESTYRTIKQLITKKSSQMKQDEFALNIAIIYNKLPPSKRAKLLAYVLYDKGIFIKSCFATERKDIRTSLPNYERPFLPSSTTTLETELNYDDVFEDKEFIESENDLKKYTIIDDDDDVARLLESVGKIIVKPTNKYGLFETLLTDVSLFVEGSFDKRGITNFINTIARKNFPENALDLAVLHSYFFTQEKKEESKKLSSKKEDVKGKRSNKDFLGSHEDEEFKSQGAYKKDLENYAELEDSFF